jgi:hypothetical protein
MARAGPSEVQSPARRIMFAPKGFRLNGYPKCLPKGRSIFCPIMTLHVGNLRQRSVERCAACATTERCESCENRKILILGNGTAFVGRVSSCAAGDALY